MPFVTALTTPFPPTFVRPHAETLSKIKKRERDIQRYKRQIQELDFAIAIQESYKINLDQSDLIPRTSSASPPAVEHLDEAMAQEIKKQEEQIQSLMQSLSTKRQEYANKQYVTSPALRRTVETPGPHRLQPRPERPADITYKQQQEQQKQKANRHSHKQAHLMTRLPTSSSLSPKSSQTTTNSCTPTTFRTPQNSMARGRKRFFDPPELPKIRLNVLRGSLRARSSKYGPKRSTRSRKTPLRVRRS